MLRRDDASVHVLEAVILALVLLAAAHSVASMRDQGPDPARPRASLERVAHDAMTVLSGLDGPQGRLLDAYVQEAFQCAAGIEVASLDCEGTRSANLSLRIEHYLPPGAGWALALDNGISARDLHRSHVPPGETASATFPYVPRWNLTFLASELSCYEPGMEANLTALPLRHGASVPLDALTLRDKEGRDAAAVRAHLAGAWNVTLPTESLGSAALARVDVLHRGDLLPGAVRIGACDLGGRGEALVEALRGSDFRVETPTIGLGGAARFVADLHPLLDVPGLEIVETNVTLYLPLPPRGDEPDTFVPAKVLVPSDPLKGEVVWTVPEDALLGTHPVVLKTALRIDGGPIVEARRVDAFTVAFPDGTVPIAPPYRAVLQVWFSDWR